MKAAERRKAIARRLGSDRPISASTLAKEFSVSRQIIVGDIALLRVAGVDIIATPRGYQLGETSGLIRAVACVHLESDLEQELLTIVDNGCTVIDVVVDHPLYGQITGQLSLSSRYDVRQFAKKARDIALLSSLTGGLHIHNLRCPDEEAYQRVCKSLDQQGILYTPQKNDRMKH